MGPWGGRHEARPGLAASRVRIYRRGATMDLTADRARHDTLQSQLHSRKSVFHFAHAAVSLLLALIAAGVAATLFADEQLAHLSIFALVTATSGGLFLYGFVRWGVGRQALAREVTLFAEMQVLRRALGFDDPSALLPR